MHPLPNPDQIEDPSDLTYHWVWLDLFIQRAMMLAPFPGDHVPNADSRFARLKTMVEAAEAIARRILIMIALTLAPIQKRLAKPAPAPQSDRATPAPAFSTQSTQTKDPPPMIPMAEPFSNESATATRTKPTAPTGFPFRKHPRSLQGEPLNWTHLMLRLAICRRLVLNPLPAATKMRARMESFAPLPPVPLTNPPRLTHHQLDKDVPPLAALLNAVTTKALYPSGLPPG